MLKCKSEMFIQINLIEKDNYKSFHILNLLTNALLSCTVQTFMSNLKRVFLCQIFGAPNKGLKNVTYFLSSCKA